LEGGQQLNNQNIINELIPLKELSAVSHKLFPFIDVLPALLREVNLLRTNRLNPWERDSARTTGSQRSPEFREKVIKYYKRITNSRKQVKCQVLDVLIPFEQAKVNIVATHIWKASTRGKGLHDFGLQPIEVNSPRNGLFITKGIEEAFDNQQVCFLYNTLQHVLVLWVADSAIMTETVKGSAPRRTFADVHQHPLLCPDHDHLPYRRLLSWHARLTLDLRKESLPVQNFTSEYDNSPGRLHAETNKLLQTIDAMVGPGEDASVRDEEND
jgi:hypothetical protein